MAKITKIQPCQLTSRHIQPYSLKNNVFLYTISGGPSGNRTHSLIHAMDARYQLRHGPSLIKWYVFNTILSYTF